MPYPPIEAYRRSAAALTALVDDLSMALAALREVERHRADRAHLLLVAGANTKSHAARVRRVAPTIPSGAQPANPRRTGSPRHRPLPIIAPTARNS